MQIYDDYFDLPDTNYDDYHQLYILIKPSTVFIQIDEQSPYLKPYIVPSSQSTSISLTYKIYFGSVIGIDKICVNSPPQEMYGCKSEIHAPTNPFFNVIYTLFHQTSTNPITFDSYVP